MAEEKKVQRTEKQAPSDRPTSETPSSRPPDGSRSPRRNGNGGKPPPPPRKASGLGFWFFLALALTVLAYAFYRCQRKDPDPRPPPQLTVNTGDEAFYKNYLASLDYLARAKVAFHQGQNWMTGAPESVPQDAPTETMPQSPLFKAATQFALALEQFKYAEDLIKGDNGQGPLKKELGTCREQYLEALDRYQSTAKLYNEHAKAKYQGPDDKAEKFALSDANARWVLAEKLMSDFLVKGCEGDLFHYLKQQKPEMRSAVLGQYEKVLGSHYQSARVDLEAKLGVVPTPASPAPTQVPAPSP